MSVTTILLLLSFRPQFFQEDDELNCFTQNKTKVHQSSLLLLRECVCARAHVYTCGSPEDDAVPSISLHFVIEAGFLTEPNLPNLANLTSRLASGSLVSTPRVLGLYNRPAHMPGF